MPERLGTAGKPHSPLAGSYCPSISRTGQEAVQNLLDLLMIKSDSEKWKMLSHAWFFETSRTVVHGILQARLLEWVAVSLLQRLFPTQGSDPGLLHCGQIFLPTGPPGKPDDEAEAYLALAFYLGTSLSQACIMGSRNLVAWLPWWFISKEFDCQSNTRDWGSIPGLGT